MFLCETLRDPHSGKWIEDFLQSKNLLEYHGTGASFVTDVRWDGPLLAMLEQPNDVMVVSAKRRGNGHGGWSKNNPYLKDRYVEFKINIYPVSLTERILAVREQLSREWVSDLEILKSANQQILDSYFQLVKKERQKPDNGPVTTPVVAFERTAVSALNNHTAFGATVSSPFRKGSFDLLYNLCTQASIHRLFNTLREKGEDSHLEWLRSFYVERLADYFDGDVSYGRADCFLEELLLSIPSISNHDGRVLLTDPFCLAEKIIETRNDIVSEWIEAMKQVPLDHQKGIRKILLDKRMGISVNSPEKPQDGRPSNGVFE